MSDNKSKPQTPVTDISVYIAALSASYRPAHNPAEATHFFTTGEIADAIRQLDPSANVDVRLVFAAMRDAGYQFCNRPGSVGLSFRWMLRAK